LAAGGVKPNVVTNERDSWDFSDWSKKDPKGLLSMKGSDLEKYNKLAADHLSKVTAVHQ
jgi:hypothetical protein